MASYNQYARYSGNPYENEGQAGGYGSSNPYGGGDGMNPYGGSYGEQQQPSNLQQPSVQHQASNYSAQSQYSQQQYGAPQDAPPMPVQGGVQYVKMDTIMSNSDFLSRVEAIKADIRTLTTQVGQVASAHQRTLGSADSGASQQLESIVSQTQVLNTQIKDRIKQLEADSARDPKNQVKTTQVQQLKSSFSKQLQEFRQEEASYEKRYREQIARQYRIVNPDASEAEVQEAAQANWGDEGVFQTALKSNRAATANTVLGAVRARHNDIQKIERTLVELQGLMEDLATQVILQEEQVQQAEVQTENVKKDTEAGNVQLDKATESARRARKLKWWCFFIVLAIIIILGLVLGLYFGLNKAATGK